MIDALTAILTLFRADAALVALATDGVHVAGELPAGLSFPSAVVVQQAPEQNGVLLGSRLVVRCYAGSQVQAKAIYNAMRDLFYQPNGLARGPRLIAGRWWLFGATLSGGGVTIEPDGWPVAFGTLDTTFDPQERT